MITAADAVAFVWEGQDGRFVEVCPERWVRRHYVSRDRALARVSDWKYFAPVTRATKGSKKINAALTCNVLWVDIDDCDDVQLALAGLPSPSLLIGTGRGYHAYWKLMRTIATDTIEVINKFISRAAGGDGVMWERSRILRVPGSIKAKTGRVAIIEAFTGEVFEPEVWMALASVTDHCPPLDVQGARESSADLHRGSLTDEELWTDVRTLAAAHPPRHRRPFSPSREFAEYMATGTTTRRSRSEEEMAILSSLWRRGWTPDEIVDFADEHLPKHRAERQSHHGSYQYLLVSMRRVIAEYSPGWDWSSSSYPPSPPSGVCDRTPISGDPKDEVWIDRFHVVDVLMGEDEMHLSALRNAIVRTFNCKPDTAKKTVAELLDTGIIVKCGKDPNDKRKDLVRRDPALYERLCRNVVTWAPLMLKVGKDLQRYDRYQRFRFGTRFRPGYGRGAHGNLTR